MFCLSNNFFNNDFYIGILFKNSLFMNSYSQVIKKLSVLTNVQNAYSKALRICRKQKIQFDWVFILHVIQ